MEENSNLEENNLEPIDYTEQNYLDNYINDNISNPQNESSYELTLDEARKYTINNLKGKFNTKRIISIGRNSYDYDEKSIQVYNNLLSTRQRMIINANNNIIPISDSELRGLNDLCLEIQSKETLILRLIKNKINDMDNIEDIINIDILGIPKELNQYTGSMIYGNITNFVQNNLYIKYYERTPEGYNIRKNTANGDIIDRIVDKFDEE